MEAPYATLAGATHNKEYRSLHKAMPFASLQVLSSEIIGRTLRMLFWLLYKLIQEVYPETGSEKLDEVSFNTGPGGRSHMRRWAWARLKDGEILSRSLQSWKVPYWKIKNPYIYCIISHHACHFFLPLWASASSIATCHRHLKPTAGNLCSIYSLYFNSGRAP